MIANFISEHYLKLFINRPLLALVFSWVPFAVPVAVLFIDPSFWPSVYRYRFVMEACEKKWQSEDGKIN